jgi:hypothetical protein
MGTLFGVMFLMVTWCLLLVWVARTAIDRGRSALVWSLIGGGAGALGIVTGFMLANRMIGADDAEISMLMTVAIFFTPLVTLIGPMVLVGWIVLREPIKVVETGSWPVSFLGKGNGAISVEHANIRVELGGAIRVLTGAQITKVEADGECVRITLPDEELIALPMGKPATPAGRKHQSLILARRLRHASSSLGSAAQAQ